MRFLPFHAFVRILMETEKFGWAGPTLRSDVFVRILMETERFGWAGPTLRGF